MREVEETYLLTTVSTLNLGPALRVIVSIYGRALYRAYSGVVMGRRYIYYGNMRENRRDDSDNPPNRGRGRASVTGAQKRK